MLYKLYYIIILLYVCNFRYTNKNKAYCIVLYCIVLYCIVLYCIVLYCIVLYCIVLYCNNMKVMTTTVVISPITLKL